MNITANGNSRVMPQLNGITLTGSALAFTAHESPRQRVHDLVEYAATPAAIARKRGLTFASQVSDTVQQVILQDV